MLKQGLLSHFCVAISMCQFHQQSNCCGEGCNRLVVVHCSTASMAWIILTSVLLRIRDSFRVQECVFVLDSSNFCLKGHGDTPQYEYFLYYFFCFFSSLNSFVSCLRAFHGHCRGSTHSPDSRVQSNHNICLQDEFPTEYIGHWIPYTDKSVKHQTGVRYTYRVVHLTSLILGVFQHRC